MAIADTPVENMSCPVCHCEEAALLRDYRPLVLYSCPSCDFGFQPLRSHDVRDEYRQEYFETYSSDDRPYEDESLRGYESRVRLNYLAELTEPGRLLEVGSASGYFLRAAEDAGWDPVGVEPCKPVAVDAMKRGTTTLVGFVEDVALTDASFDMVCGWHVLEHIPDPMATIARLRRILSPGGLAVFEVPNFACAISRRDGPRWTHLDARHHVNQFTPHSIRRLFADAGFFVHQVVTVPTRSTYAPPALKRQPREIIRQIRYMVTTRSFGVGNHPERFEILRIVAQRG